MKQELKAEHEEFAGLLEEALEETAVKLAKEAEVKIDKVKKGTIFLLKAHLQPFYSEHVKKQRRIKKYAHIDTPYLGEDYKRDIVKDYIDYGSEVSFLL